MTKDHARKNGISIEMAARELRYEWFKKIRKEEGYTAVAVAHNLNDNVETLLLNLIRGTGIAGIDRDETIRKPYHKTVAFCHQKVDRRIPQ